jgi:hypothetical protein
MISGITSVIFYHLKKCVPSPPKQRVCLSANSTILAEILVLFLLTFIHRYCTNFHDRLVHFCFTCSFNITFAPSTIFDKCERKSFRIYNLIFFFNNRESGNFSFFFLKPSMSSYRKWREIKSTSFLNDIEASDPLGLFCEMHSVFPISCCYFHIVSHVIHFSRLFFCSSNPFLGFLNNPIIFSRLQRLIQHQGRITNHSIRDTITDCNSTVLKIITSPTNFRPHLWVIFSMRVLNNVT